MIHHPLFYDRARLLFAATGRRRIWSLSLRCTISIDDDHHVILENHVNTKRCADAASPHVAMRREADVACYNVRCCPAFEQFGNAVASREAASDGCLDPCAAAR